MTIARHYRMTAKDGGAATLRTALVDLVAALQDIPGFEGAEMMQDVSTPEQFVFIERWGSVQLHKEGRRDPPQGGAGAADGCARGAARGRVSGGPAHDVRRGGRTRAFQGRRARDAISR